MHAPQLRFLDQSFGEPQLTAVPKKGAAKAVRKKGARKAQETGGEPNAGDHGEGEDGVHHLDAQPFGLARAAAAVRRGAECSAAGVGWATVR